MKLLSKKPIKGLLILAIFSLLTFDLTLVLAPKTHATCGTNAGIVNGGIISATGNTNVGDYISGNSPCVIDSNFAGIPTLPTYASMKSTYYDQATSPTGLLNTSGNKIHVYNQDEIYYDSGSLTLGTGGVASMTPPNSNNSFVIFVDGDLNINSDVKWTDYTTGALVFVVQGNINIAPTVSEIDASLISQKQICDTFTGTSPCDNTPVLISSGNPLKINGSVIDLCDPNNNDLQHPDYHCTISNPIAFNRTFINNSTTPAELITTQPQDLVLLKDIFSSTLKIETQQ